METFNRTFVELKFTAPTAFSESSNSFNRTFVELKLRIQQAIIARDDF